MDKATRHAGLTVSLAALRRLVLGLAFIGIALGVVGIREAYARLGFNTTEGRIVTVAIAVAAVTVAATLIVTRRIAARADA